MCGIIGVTKGEEKKVIHALDVITHRGPDQRDTYTDDRVTLGHCRLSVIDIREEGKQPMSTADGMVTIVYNGEIYNYKKLKEDLENQGCKFHTQTDTEVVLEGYRREGISFFKKLRGMWALALYDNEKERIIISRDQFGIKPLYYTLNERVLYFSSEMRAFETLGVPLAPNTNHFFEFFNLGYFIAPATCYKDIFLLCPGDVGVFSLKNKSLSIEKLDFDKGSQGTDVYLSEEESIKNLRTILRESVSAHHVSDVPVATLFSGGNDSSLIAALSKEAGHSVEAYHLDVEGSVDTKYAKEIARHLEIKLEVISMSNNDIEEQYGLIWDALDFPFADTSVIPTSLVYKKIGGKSKVVLSGDGGDELFGGYVRHKKLAPLHTLRSGNSLTQTLDTLYGSNTLAIKLFNPLLLRARNVALLSSNDVIGRYLHEVKLINHPLHAKEIRQRLFDLGITSSQPGNLLFDSDMYLTNDLLFKTDIASMQHSIEARVPFVDREVWEFVNTFVDPSLRLSKRYQDKYLLKKILEKYLPEHLVYREKKGFSFSLSSYNIPQFKEDVSIALDFHRKNADIFDLLPYRNLFKSEHAEILIEKFPRFAFGLVSNWKIFK